MLHLGVPILCAYVGSQYYVLTLGPNIMCLHWVPILWAYIGSQYHVLTLGPNIVCLHWITILYAYIETEVTLAYVRPLGMRRATGSQQVSPQWVGILCYRWCLPVDNIWELRSKINNVCLWCSCRYEIYGWGKLPAKKLQWNDVSHGGYVLKVAH
jgi:hypothetical protein